MSTQTLEPPRTRRQAQAEERREQLLECALDLFAERGVRATTTRDIAQAAGVTEGLVFHYFGSKAGLVRAVFERHSLHGEIDELFDRLEEAPIEEAWPALGQGFVQLCRRHRKFVAVAVSEAIRDDEVAAILDHFMGRCMERGRAFLQRRVDRGELRPHDVTVTMRLMQGSTLWFALMHGRLWSGLPEYTPEQFEDAVSGIVFQGIRAREDRAGDAQGGQG